MQQNEFLAIVLEVMKGRYVMRKQKDSYRTIYKTLYYTKKIASPLEILIYNHKTHVGISTYGAGPASINHEDYDDGDCNVKAIVSKISPDISWDDMNKVMEKLVTWEVEEYGYYNSQSLDVYRGISLGNLYDALVELGIIS